MRHFHIIILLTYACAMGIGQILFKYVAIHGVDPALPSAQRWLSLATNVTFLFAVAFYGVLTLAWIWILSFIPLSKGYPFTVMSIAVAGIGSHALFGESLSPRFFIAVGFITLGLLVLSWD
ncbi:4-amino-4-deoxy-L-arabinose-phospho-UDP flippase [Pandoraea soli]|uniref:4-amino-4-deoxy-L-arabinose-phosphoundecaprenol flippase subunit ArnE n=1 Tax=Pandoraea soli TaxID=2508293 RepID=A0ABY6W6M5_9BURK|nr:4-amino-4-deoxy-L-arabinose-phospho-UDP flippase [Pandoraea soli]VVE32873.1 4-amino-4-deoxy-L-arabinose-phosphoundecaprenol flippase subunit ArnE [Pandoraea soli]